VLIDGGKGQLKAAVKGIEKAGLQSHIPVCALAKEPDRVFILGTDAPVNEEQDTPGLLLLRSLRDEAHRFALAAHRRMRSLVKKQP
jgi:excinuclease ABC subunit C